MNILVTIDQNYINTLKIMLFSLKSNHPKQIINVYLLHRTLTKDDINNLKQELQDDTFKIIDIKLSFALDNVYTTDRYPIEMYDRLFAPLYLPENLDRILYLDPDIIVKGDLNELYNLDFQDKVYAGATHIEEFLTYINEKRLNVDNIDIYVNTGVLLMNLEQLRKIIDPQVIIDTINKNRHKLILPDQDIITILFGNSILEIDTLIYNLSDRMLTIANVLNRNIYSKDWIEQNVKIIHYCGRNKPWKNNYIGQLNTYYNHYLDLYNQAIKQHNI